MSKDYWLRRAVELAKQNKQSEEQFVRYLNRAFNTAKSLISNEIIKKIEDIATIEDLSMLDAVDFINANKLEDVKVSLERYISLGSIDYKTHKEQLKKASNAYHLSYYQEVEAELDEVLTALYEQTEKALRRSLDDTYLNNYYRTSYDIQKVQGYSYLTRINRDKLEYLKNMPWLEDGRDFSSRLWRHKEILVNKLRAEMTASTLIQRGRQDTYKRMSRKDFLMQVAKSTSESIDQAKRRMKTLVYTESARMANEARADSFKEHGIEKYVITATLDLKTSYICQKMDGKEFFMSEKQVGINYPPFHPNCRTTVRPPRKSIGTRTARDHITGRSYAVEGNLKYRDWHKKYIR